MLPPIRFRLAEDDRQRYGGDEWLPLRVEMFAELRLSELRRIEQVVEAQLGMKLFELLRGTVPLREMEPLAVVIWLALRLNKPDAVGFEEFDPKLTAAEWQLIDPPARGGGAVPPPKSSAGNSAETPGQAGRSPSRRRRGSRR